MKLQTITIENIRSFRSSTKVSFDPTFNVFVGPNSGGKSNLLDIITVLMRHFLLRGVVAEDSSDQFGPFKNLVARSPFGDVSRILDKFIGDEAKSSSIAVQMIIGEPDCKNVHWLRDHRAALEAELNRYRGKPCADLAFLDHWDVSLLSPGVTIGYRIENLNLRQDLCSPVERLALEYMQFFEMFLAFSRDDPTIRISPAYLYFSPYRAASPGDLRVALSGENTSQLLASYYASTSTASTSLIRLAALRLAEIRRRYEAGAGAEGFDVKWSKDPEVKQVSQYLERLNYAWKLECLDASKNIYEIILTRAGKQFHVNQASSGEREIINFILGIFAFGISHGLVVIDEPELHLHPRWQSVLRDLLLQVAQETDNQLVISTHSPAFITPATIGSVRRVARVEESGSTVVEMEALRAGDKRALLHIVNTYNSERLFFADMVVLVEGITDRVVFERLFTYYREVTRSTQVVEVVEVHGKENFAKYRDFLAAAGITSWVVADLDYVQSTGGAQIAALFETDWKRIGEALADKHSTDRTALAMELEAAFTANDLGRARPIWGYIKSRHARLRDNLSQVEQQELDRHCEALHTERTIILRRGEIEDYLPDQSRSLDAVVELVREETFEKWISGVQTDDRVRDLVNLTLEVLGLTPTYRAAHIAPAAPAAPPA